MKLILRREKRLKQNLDGVFFVIFQLVLQKKITNILFGNVKRVGRIAIEVWHHECDGLARVIVEAVANVEHDKQRGLIEYELHFLTRSVVSH